MSETKLQQTKNAFKLIGIVTRIDKDGAFREEKATQGKNKGKTYRSLRFGVKTSETNEVTVEMFDFEPDEVFLWNSEKAKKAKENNKTYKGTRIPFEEWLEKEDELREEGYVVLQTRIGLTYGEDGKIKSKGLPSYVASKEIYKNLNNGDSVVIEGEIRYGTYEGRDGKQKEKKTFVIKKLHKIKDIDFENEKFEEVSYFEQEMVFIDAYHEKSEKKVYITGRHINYDKKSWHNTQFVVDYSDGEDGEDADMKKLANAFLKKFKFGDLFNGFGNILNRVIIEEKEEDEEGDDDLLSQLGGKSKPKHAQGFISKSYISEMQIHGVDMWHERVYKKEDFIVEDSILDVNDSNDLSSELGGKSKRVNPFDLDSDGDSDDDLPFSDEDLPF